MPSKISAKYKYATKIWRARVKDNGSDYFIGVYTTYDEALAAENAFRYYIGKPAYLPRKRPSDAQKTVPHAHAGSE